MNKMFEHQLLQEYKHRVVCIASTYHKKMVNQNININKIEPKDAPHKCYLCKEKLFNYVDSRGIGFSMESTLIVEAKDPNALWCANTINVEPFTGIETESKNDEVHNAAWQDDYMNNLG